MLEHKAGIRATEFEVICGCDCHTCLHIECCKGPNCEIRTIHDEHEANQEAHDGGI